MSSPFGVPPPPPTQVFEPRPGLGTASTLRVEDLPPTLLVAERNPGRRRLALACAFLAVALLVFANIASWLHVGDVSSQQANATAAATFGAVTADLRPQILTSITPRVTKPADRSSDQPTTANDDPQLVLDIAAATDSALASDQTKAAWRTAVATGLVEQRQLLEGTSTDARAEFVLNSAPILAETVATLQRNAYTVDTRGVAVPSFKVTTTTTIGVGSTLGAVGDLWWLMALGAIALGAASIVLARRRIRMGVILALDAAAMLVVCLLLVAVIRASTTTDGLTTVETKVLDEATAALTQGLVNQTLTLMALALVSALVLGVVARNRRKHRGGRGRSDVDPSGA